MTIDTSELFSEQPLVDEGNDNGEGLDTSAETYESTSDADAPPATGDEPPANPPAGRNQKVPLIALHEERAKRQQHEADLASERRRNQVLQDRFNKFLMDQQAAQQQTQQQAPEAPPAFEEDPVAAFNHAQKQLQDMQRTIQEYQQGIQQQTQAQQEHVQLAQTVSAQEATFTQAVPDYPVAADYFYQRKVAEYAAFTGDVVAAQWQVANDYKGIAALAQRLGKNPAELMYNAAKAMGYTPGAKQPTQQRREAPTSLANVSGAARAPDEKGNITAADISEMSQAEFDKFWDEEVARKNRNKGPKF